jgi:hypothetical protein
LADGSLLVSERDTGPIVRVVDGRLEPGITVADVRPGGAGGLLGLTLTPDTKTLFAYFTAADDNRIVAMSWDGPAWRALDDLHRDPQRQHPQRWSNGDQPDGFLYVGTGGLDEPVGIASR